MSSGTSDKGTSENSVGSVAFSAGGAVSTVVSGALPGVSDTGADANAFAAAP